MQTPVEASIGLERYRPWFYVAAAYNLVWGASVILWPGLLWDILGLKTPDYLPVWQVVGMFVLVFAPAYWWAARYPSRHAHLIAVGFFGKVLGPIGFVWAVAFGDFPVIFGLTILTNDLIWYPAFACYLRDVSRDGGWRGLLLGE